MNQDNFTNREIKTMFDSLKETLQEHGKTHADILTAVKTTNGKVADIQGWRERMNGGAIVASSFMGVVIIPIIAWVVYSVLNMDTIVERSLDKALQTYEINP